MTKKKILVFIDWYLPGYKAGGPIQSVANLVAHLKDEYDFYIVTRNTDYCETIPYTNVVSDDWNVLENGVSVYYISAEKLNFSTIRSLIDKTKVDAVYLNGIYSLYFTLFPLWILNKKSNLKIVVAARGMFASGAMNIKRRKKQLFITVIKFLRLFSKVTFHATNANEKDEIQKVLGDVQIKIAANLPQKSIIDRLNIKDKKAGELKLVNIARVAPEKNLLFALEVLKQVKTAVTFDIYGPIYNQDYWIKCQGVIKELPENIKVNYRGSVESDKVLTTLQAYDFMFMPTLGENFGHIILQSLSVGCPVIISDKTPWKNLKEKNIGWDIDLLDKNMFITVIETLVILDKAQYNLMQQSSFEFAKKYINNEETVKDNKQLFI